MGLKNYWPCYLSEYFDKKHFMIKTWIFNDVYKVEDFEFSLELIVRIIKS